MSKSVLKNETWNKSKLSHSEGKLLTYKNVI